MAEVCSVRVIYCWTDVKDGWCEGDLGQQRDDGSVMVEAARQCPKDRKEWRTQGPDAGNFLRCIARDI